MASWGAGDMTFFILGGEGRLGRALKTEFDFRKVHMVSRSEIDRWAGEGARAVETYFRSVDARPNDVVFVAFGSINPGLPQDELIRTNFVLPKTIIEGSSAFGLNVVTFGTVMEGEGFARNGYIESKIRLAEHVQQEVSKGNPALHVRMHTHYGIGRPSRFMFLGNLLEAIESKTTLRMSSGMQLREFHHLNDEARAIRAVIEASSQGLFTISHGSPVTLREVAERALLHFGLSGFLLLNELLDPPNENYSETFMSHDILATISFRSALPGIIDYLSECING